MQDVKPPVAYTNVTQEDYVMVEERNPRVEDSDVEDVNTVDADVAIDRSSEEREVDIQTGGLAVDVEKAEDTPAEDGAA